MKSRKEFRFYPLFAQFLRDEAIELKTGEKALFCLILDHLSLFGTVSMFDIVKANNGNKNTTYSNLKSLRRKGFIKTERSSQFYSPSFIELTEKGSLFASRLRKALNS